MTQKEAKLLEEAKQFCDDNDKSTEFMLQYMSDVANVSHDTVMEYLKPTPDALAFIKGCNTGTSKYSLKGRELSNFDKNKIMNMLKLMTQKEFDRVFTTIQDLQHHKTTTVGLLATDKTVEDIAQATAGAFHNTAVKHLESIMFTIK